MNKFGELWQYVETVKPEIERALRTHLPLAPQTINTNLNDALSYALFPGGKRLRPVLTLLGAEAVGGRREKVLPTAAAVEFVHTSSLIFDDLPCMDDALERRGKTSLHQMYGEGAAVLVGLALLNASYGLVFSNVNGNAKQAIRAHAELVNGIGASGMVGGQSIDLQIAAAQNGNARCAHEFEKTRNLKTSALIRMAVCIGAIQSGASEQQANALCRFAELVGDAYQTSDDLLDLQEDLHISNTTERRQTFALEQGFNNARARVAGLTANAKDVLRGEFGESEPSRLLCLMADYIAERKA
jgi:geranylgeranyl diphosphate synthase, type II